MSWFEDWFDSPLYEKLYSNRNEEEAHLLADLIEDEIPKQSYPEILDLGCGRGRHSIALARRGYQVTGIDLSEEVIGKAEEIAEEERLKNVTFLTGDMREPLDQRFDAVLNLFTTFGYFLEENENVRVLGNVQKMLKNEGKAIIDFLNASWVEAHLVPMESGSFQSLEYTIRRKIRDGMVFKTISFRGDKLRSPVQYEERVKLYELSWFRNQLKNKGLAIDKVYGDYTGAAFVPEESPRLIMVCSKNK